MWATVHVIALIALLRKECLRVSWEEMDAIDQAEDEEAEFIFAESKYVVGQQETQKGKDEWAKYQKFDVMERADLYAQSNNIKRTGTFVKRMTKHKQRKQTNLDKAYDDALKKEEAQMAKTDETVNSGEDKLEVFVPSKLNKVSSDSPKTESALTTSIELSQPKEEEEEKEESEDKDKDTNADYVAVVQDKADDEEQLINKSEEVGHDYNETVETVVVKEDEENEDEDENENENEKEDYVQVDNNSENFED